MITGGKKPEVISSFETSGLDEFLGIEFPENDDHEYARLDTRLLKIDRIFAADNRHTAQANEQGCARHFRPPQQIVSNFFRIKSVTILRLISLITPS